MSDKLYCEDDDVFCACNGKEIIDKLKVRIAELEEQYEKLRDKYKSQLYINVDLNKEFEQRKVEIDNNPWKKIVDVLVEKYGAVELLWDGALKDVVKEIEQKDKAPLQMTDNEDGTVNIKAGSFRVSNNGIQLYTMEDIRDAGERTFGYNDPEFAKVLSYLTYERARKQGEIDDEKRNGL